MATSPVRQGGRSPLDGPRPIARRGKESRNPMQAFLGRTLRHSPPQNKLRSVGWHTVEHSTDEDEAAHNEAEAKIEVAMRCRTREEIFDIYVEVIKARPKLSTKHRELLGSVVRGLIGDRRVSYYMICAMRTVFSAAAAAWRGAREKGVSAPLCVAAASSAAELTLAGVSPTKAAERAVQTAATKGLGAVKNLVLQHKTQSQRQQHASAAAAALRRAQAIAAQANNTSEGSEDICSEAPQPETDRGEPLVAPDSAAAVGRGIPIPDQLKETVISESFLPHAAYFDKRLEVFAQMLVDEIRDLAGSTLKLVEEKLVLSADSNETKLFYLQLSADASRYASQLLLDSQEKELFRIQSLKMYRTALEFFDRSGEEELFLSAKMGLVLNYGVMLYEEPDGVMKALHLLADQFREAVERVVHLTDPEEGRKVMMVMGLIRGNVEAWCKELGRSDAAALLGLATPTSRSRLI